MLFIVISHCYTILSLNNGYIISLFDDLGRLGVLFFILISGYFSNKDQKNTFLDNLKIVKKRLLKFYPLYVLSLVVMIIIMFTSSDTKHLFIQFIADLLLIQSFLPFKGGTYFPYSLNTPAWYLSMIVFIWIVEPFLHHLKNKYDNIQFIFIIFMTLLISLFIFDIMIQSTTLQRYFMYINPIVNMFIYMLGMTLIAKVIKYKIPLSISLIFLIVTYFTKNIIPVDWRVCLLIIPTILLISSLISSKHTIDNGVSNCIKHIGRNSMLILLTHYPICYIMRKLYFNKGYFYFFITIFLILVVYYLIFLFTNKTERGKVI